MSNVNAATRRSAWHQLLQAGAGVFCMGFIAWILWPDAWLERDQGPSGQLRFWGWSAAMIGVLIFVVAAMVSIYRSARKQ